MCGYFLSKQDRKAIDWPIVEGKHYGFEPCTERRKGVNESFVLSTFSPEVLRHKPYKK